MTWTLVHVTRLHLVTYFIGRSYSWKLESFSITLLQVNVAFHENDIYMLCAAPFTDIDECTKGTDNCTQTCTNTLGSYTCSCGDGYILNTDSITCDGKNTSG